MPCTPRHVYGSVQVVVCGLLLLLGGVIRFLLVLGTNRVTAQQIRTWEEQLQYARHSIAHFLQSQSRTEDLLRREFKASCLMLRSKRVMALLPEPKDITIRRLNAKRGNNATTKESR